ncbi:NAD(P)-binding protein [Hypoxylon sp. NC0597]|nr:NAD(P)-binding protein [Hypoxylon sp. NC0597]
MSSYVVTGVSRGIGFEFLRQLSADPSAVVIGLARDKAATEKKVAAEIGRPNIHILHGDLIDYESLKKAVEDTSKITGGSLDYLIANGAFLSKRSHLKTLHDLSDDPKTLEEELLMSYKTNVVGNIHLFNLFIPLIRKGKAKKVIAISSGMADVDLVRDFELDMAAPYALSKVAMNFAVAKYDAEFRSQGILFMSICPGVVETSGHNDTAGLSPKELQSLEKMMRKFGEYAPHFKGPIMPDESVKSILNVINNASVERGDGGSFVSHFGNKQWI